LYLLCVSTREKGNKGDIMKSLMKGGTAAALSLVLCSPIAQAANVGNTLKQQSQVSSNLNQITEGKITSNGTQNLNSPSSQPLSIAEIAKLLPNNAPLVGFIDTTPETWQTLGRFQIFNMAWEAIIESLPSQDFNFTTQIQPWLGEQAAIAFLPKVGKGTIDLDSSYVMIVPLKDETRFQTLLSQFRSNEQRVTQREYKGTTILEMKTGSLPRLSTKPIPRNQQTEADSISSLTILRNKKDKTNNSAIALMSGHIIFGTSAKSVERIIDNSQEIDTTSLAEKLEFQEAIANPPAGKVLFRMYQNPQTFLALIKDIAKDPSFSLPPSATDIIDPKKLEEFVSLSSSVALQPEGLRVQIQANRDPSKAKKNVKDEKVLGRMPAATYSSLTGRNLNGGWQSLVNTFDDIPEGKKGLKEFRNFVKTNLNLDFDRDIMGWMDGEFAFFLYPTKGGAFNMFSSNMNLGMGLTIQTSNKIAAEATLKKLEKFINSFSAGIVGVNNSNIKGQAITSWDMAGDSATSLLAYSWTDDDTLILTTGLGAIKDLVPQPKIALNSTYNFTTATSSLPSPNNGYFYMNMGSLLSWGYSFLPPQYQDENFKIFKKAMGSVYSISATTSTSKERDQYDALFVLAPKR
jgi:Protein of unknown function (DUF3352)